MKDFSKVVALLIILTVIAIFWGCSKDKPTDGNGDEYSIEGRKTEAKYSTESSSILS